MDILMNLKKYSTRQAMNKGVRNVRATRKKRIAVRISIVLLLTLVALVIFNKVGKESTEEGYEMIDAREPIIVEFPLRGEWHSPNTPGTKIPSHGTNKLGSRYAYDFIQVD